MSMCCGKRMLKNIQCGLHPFLYLCNWKTLCDARGVLFLTNIRPWVPGQGLIE